MKQYRFNSHHLITIIAITFLLFTNCSREEEDRTRNDSRNLKNPKSTFIYNSIPDNPNAEISEEYSIATNTFSINLLKEVYSQEKNNNKNLVLSPFSVSRVLSVIAEGAEGKTKNEILNALGGQSALDDAQNALSELLYADESIVLQCADALWLDSTKYSLKSNFKNLVNSKYGVEISKLNFTDSINSAKTINSWISLNTNYKVNNFVSPNSLNNSALILTNAIYFEADWTSPFNVLETVKSDFHTPDGVTRVDMMASCYYHEVNKTEEYDNAKIYYGTNNIDFFYLDIYMPKITTIEDFLETQSLKAISNKDSLNNAILKMPKFSFTTNTDLIPALKNLGIKESFEPSSAELTGILEDTPSNGNLYVKHVQQQAGIKTDEEGTEAYAVTVSYTGVGASGESSPDVIVDHPFIYFIRAGKNGLILFAGIVNNPNNS